MDRWRASHANRALVLVTCVSVAAACAPDTDAPSAGPLVRDSAGITVVENGGPQWSQDDAWTVGAEPFLTLGVVVGPEVEQFSRVAAVVRRSDGAVLVADGGSQEIRAFGADGALLWRAGGEGEGPGEFQGLAGLHLLPGDSLAVSDTRHRRVTVLDPDGGLVRTYRPEPRPGAAMAAPVGRLSDTEWIYTGGASFSAGDGAGGSTERAPVGYYRAGPDGTWIDSLTTLQSREMFVQRDGGSIAVWGVPFGRESLTATGAGRVVWGESERAEWHLRHADGRRWIVRLDATPELVTDGDWARAVEERVPADPDVDPDARRRALDAYAEMTRPAAWPFFDNLEIDPAGHLWVQQYRAPWADGGTRVWWVFDSEGVYLGAVVFPGTLDVHQIGDDTVVGVVTDELGVERVQVHRLRRGG